jgi:hypothetical protein
MADADSSSRRRRRAQIRPAAELLGPLWQASPEPWQGRIRTLAEARAALAIPSARTDDIMRLFTPPDLARKVAPVSDDQHPDRVAEFAYLRVFTRASGRLAPLPRSARLPMRETSNAFWIVYGSLILAAHGSLVIDTLAIGPAFDGQMSDRRDDAALGVTAELLRLLSPAQLLNEAVEQLQRDGHMLDVFAQQTKQPMSQRQRELLDKLSQAPRAAAPPTTDEQLAEIAKRYIELCRRGLRHPLPHLAQELGITRTQARDRIHKARKKHYLAPGHHGRATPDIGPRLTELGWKPPPLLQQHPTETPPTDPS